MKNTLFLIAFVFFGAANNAQAAFISADWKVDGDNKATVDTEAGLEWLKLNQTDGMSIDSVVSQMGAGQAFEGWRLPTLSEVFNVSHHFFGQRLGYAIEGSYKTYQKPGTRSRGGSRYFPYESAMGQTYIANRTVDRLSRGLFVNTEDANLESVLMSGLDYYTADSQANDYMNHYSNFQGAYTTSFSNYTYGVFLVSDGGTTKTSQDDMSLMANNPNSPYNATAVPEPAGLAMLCMGLFMLAFKRKQSNNT